MSLLCVAEKKGEYYSTTKIYGYIKRDDVSEDYKFWLALLNSQLFWFFIQSTGYVLRGGYYTFKTDYINPFPIPKIISASIHDEVVETVNIILEMKAESIKNDISEFENLINKSIYSLYNLTEQDVTEIEKQAYI